MIELSIRQAFETRLEEWAKSEGLCVQFEGRTFDPPADNAYLRATLLMAPAVPNDACSGETHSGVFQIDYMGLPLQGSDAAAVVIGGLRGLFPLDQILKAGGFQVWQTTPLRTGPTISDVSRHMVPTSFQFIAYL